MQHNLQGDISRHRVNPPVLAEEQIYFEKKCVARFVHYTINILKCRARHSPWRKMDFVLLKAEQLHNNIILVSQSLESNTVQNCIDILRVCVCVHSYYPT